MDTETRELDTYETCIDVVGNKATITASERWSIKLISNLLKEYPEEVELLATNPDGSMLAVVPKKWIKIRPPKKVSEETRLKASENLRIAREKRG